MDEEQYGKICKRNIYIQSCADIYENGQLLYINFIE